MSTSARIDLDAWAAEVVADPPVPADDDRLSDWAIQVVALAQESLVGSL